MSSSAGVIYMYMHGLLPTDLETTSHAVLCTTYTLQLYSDYKSRLANVRIIFFLFSHEFLDIMLLIKSLKDAPDNFQLHQLCPH